MHRCDEATASDESEDEGSATNSDELDAEGLRAEEEAAMSIEIMQRDFERAVRRVRRDLVATAWEIAQAHALYDAFEEGARGAAVPA